MHAAGGQCICHAESLLKHTHQGPEVGVVIIADIATKSNGPFAIENHQLRPIGNFYGTTQAGGAHNVGTVFKITLGGILTTLYSFGGNDGGYGCCGPLRANIAETLLVSLITEQGGKGIQHEEHEDILSGPVRRAASGGIGALLRREGLYSSHLVTPAMSALDRHLLTG